MCNQYILDESVSESNESSDKYFTAEEICDSLKVVVIDPDEIYDEDD